MPVRCAVVGRAISGEQDGTRKGECQKEDKTRPKGRLIKKNKVCRQDDSGERCVGVMSEQSQHVDVVDIESNKGDAGGKFNLHEIEPSVHILQSTDARDDDSVFKNRVNQGKIKCTKANSGTKYFSITFYEIQHFEFYLYSDIYTGVKTTGRRQMNTNKKTRFMRRTIEKIVVDEILRKS